MYYKPTLDVRETAHGLIIHTIRYIQFVVNHKFGEVRMTVSGNYRGSTNFLDVVRGIV